MPCRLIRDDMLESERVLGLPVEARWLYVTILLSADDVGLFEANSFKLSRRADMRREQCDQLLSMLADADLVRLYEAEGKRFGFIPKFRQRVQIKFVKHPVPDEALMADDEDAFNKIKHLANKTTVGQPLGNGDPPAAQPSEAKAKAKVEEEKQRAGTHNDAARATRLPAELTLPDEWAAFCRATRPELNPQLVFDGFRDYWLAKAGRDGAKRDWAATWRNWVRNERQRQPVATRAEAAQALMRGLTRGLVGGHANVKLIA